MLLGLIHQVLELLQIKCKRCSMINLCVVSNPVGLQHCKARAALVGVGVEVIVAVTLLKDDVAKSSELKETAN